MVDVEQRTLRAFEQHALALLAQLVKDAGDVGLHRFDVLAEGERVVERLLEVDGFDAEVLGQHEVVIVHRAAQLLGQFVRVAQIGDANAAARNLVFVGRTDAAAGGADGLAAGSLLAGLIQGDVVRHDQRRGRADLEARTHFDAAGLEFGDFLLQRAGVQHDAVADQAQRVVAQDAGGNQVQDGLLAVDDEGVAGVVAALEADDARRCPASAGRRSCPCLRRPTGRPTPRLTDPSQISCRPGLGPVAGWPFVLDRVQTRKKPEGRAPSGFCALSGF